MCHYVRTHHRSSLAIGLSVLVESILSSHPLLYPRRLFLFYLCSIWGWRGWGVEAEKGDEGCMAGARADYVELPFTWRPGVLGHLQRADANQRPKASVLVRLRRALDRKWVAVRPTWPALAGARHILFVLTVLVSFSKLASACQFE
jgi:hypothetical protein